MPKYMKLMLRIPLSSASRNKHELDAAYEAGYKVSVYYTEPNLTVTDELARYELHNYDPGIKVSRFRPLTQLRIIGSWLRFARVLRRERPDVISCHNIPNMTLAWFASRLVFPRPKLIYDAHEFNLEARGNISAKERAKTEKWENFFLHRVTFSIMVNDSIADEVQKHYGLSQRPVVVRSTPPYWTLDEEKIREKRRMFCSALGVSEDTFLIMFHGGITTLRGVENMIRATGRDPAIACVLLGSCGEPYRRELQQLAEECGAAGRVYFHPAVEVNELWQYAGAADVGCVMTENTCRNHYLSSPNKFFENIQSLTPVICPTFPEMERIVAKYGIGLCCPPGDLDAFCACITKMRTDRAFYRACKEHLAAAKNDLCWENEKNALLDAYRRYL